MVFYTILTYIAQFILKIVAHFSPKIKLFVTGRKAVFPTLEQKINPTDKTLWFHAASLGEYEQGLPVMEKLKEQFPTYKIIVSFFSPSGYEVKKNNPIAHATVYLPLDTKANVKKFIAAINPEMVFFIKYEFWPNYLNELHKQNIPTFLISGIFRKNQAFFKWYGGFYRNALNTFHHFFVQNNTSKELIKELGFNNVTVSGDTRFDRVYDILNRNNQLDFIETFISNTTPIKKNTTVVIGSSWPKDEELLVNFINQSASNVKFIIAPHNIKQDQIDQLEQAITKKTIRYSTYNSKKQHILSQSNRNNVSLDLDKYQVFIIDAIGLLTTIYSYADIAYVGGGFGNPGIHNILEPATFGVPIIIGPNYAHFAEATALVEAKGCISIKNQNELNDAFNTLLINEDERNEKGHICETFVQMNKGATTKIIDYIELKKLL